MRQRKPTVEELALAAAISLPPFEHPDAVAGNTSTREAPPSAFRSQLNAWDEEMMRRMGIRIE